MELAMSGQTRARVLEPQRERQIRRPVTNVLSTLQAQQVQAWAEKQRFQILQRNMTNTFLSGQW